MEMHTEKGRQAERYVVYFLSLVICHINKRLDIGLRAELAQAGLC
jgi:hypothetical protein